MQHSYSHYNAFCSCKYTSMQPLHCDLQPQIRKHPTTRHTRRTTHCKTPSRNQSHAKTNGPQPPHTRAALRRRLQPLYTETHMVSCSGFLPKANPMQHPRSHYNAFCSARWQTRIYPRTWQQNVTTIMQPFHCDQQPQIPKHPITTHTQTHPKQLQPTITAWQQKLKDRITGRKEKRYGGGSVCARNVCRREVRERVPCKSVVGERSVCKVKAWCVEVVSGEESCVKVLWVKGRYGWRSMSPSATPATQSDGRCRQVPKVEVDVAKRHACHAKWKSMSPSATPATQTAAAMSPSATPATQSEGRCHQVPRLPRKVKVHVGKCHACHANSRGDHGAKRGPKPAQCYKCHAMWRSMSPSATPTTQSDGRCRQVLHLHAK